MKTIAVYGSSAALPGEKDYDDAYAVGKALAEAGFDVMTGGYAGVMEAISRGASEAGGHVIGVTTARIENFRGGDLRPNRWVVDEIRHPTLRERVMHLILEADAYVTMPGGLGTLHELVSVWEMTRLQELPPRPLLCYGLYWQQMLAGVRTSRYFTDDLWQFIEFVSSPEEVVAALRRGKTA